MNVGGYIGESRDRVRGETRQADPVAGGGGFVYAAPCGILNCWRCLFAEDELMSDGAELIAAERRRQVDSEGWTPERDDRYTSGALWRAAAAYLVGGPQNDPPEVWPDSWGLEWWKPTPDNRIRELVKAGALIAAEIDRLQREARGDG